MTFDEMNAELLARGLPTVYYARYHPVPDAPPFATGGYAGAVSLVDVERGVAVGYADRDEFTELWRFPTEQQAVDRTLELMTWTPPSTPSSAPADAREPGATNARAVALFRRAVAAAPDRD